MKFCSISSARAWVARQVDDVRRQAPAARMIGEFAVREGVRFVEARTRRPSSEPQKSQNAHHNGSTASDVSTTSANENAAPLSDDVNQREPFPGYDTYTSRQVVDRLASISPEEKILVRNYESTHRRRETILAALSNVESVGSSAPH